MLEIQEDLDTVMSRLNLSKERNENIDKVIKEKSITVNEGEYNKEIYNKDGDREDRIQTVIKDDSDSGINMTILIRTS